jgi:hypothetical protein
VARRRRSRLPPGARLQHPRHPPTSRGAALRTRPPTRRRAAATRSRARRLATGWSTAARPPVTRWRATVWAARCAHTRRASVAPRAPAARRRARCRPMRRLPRDRRHVHQRQQAPRPGTRANPAGARAGRELTGPLTVDSRAARCRRRLALVPRCGGQLRSIALSRSELRQRAARSDRLDTRASYASTSTCSHQGSGATSLTRCCVERSARGVPDPAARPCSSRSTRPSSRALHDRRCASRYPRTIGRRPNCARRPSPCGDGLAITMGRLG